MNCVVQIFSSVFFAPENRVGWKSIGEPKVLCRKVKPVILPIRLLTVRYSIRQPTLAQLVAKGPCVGMGPIVLRSLVIWFRSQPIDYFYGLRIEHIVGSRESLCLTDCITSPERTLGTDQAQGKGDAAQEEPTSRRMPTSQLRGNCNHVFSSA